MYSRKLLIMGRGNARNMYIFFGRINLGNWCVSFCFVKKKFVTMDGHMEVKLNCAV
jgi:hypothetical protein